MAEELGVARTTLHHHFVILRSSGLLRIRTSDNRYRLREETFADVAGLLEAFLKPTRWSRGPFCWNNMDGARPVHLAPIVEPVLFSGGPHV